MLQRSNLAQFTVDEYWLTEPQALKVIAKSETAKADAILSEVIAVFVAWRHGRLPVANTNGAITNRGARQKNEQRSATPATSSNTR